MVRFVLVGAMLGCLVGIPSLGRAQGSDAEARALYSAGEIAYAEGRYESALGYFQRAHELSARPALLFNIGSAAERVRQDDVALDAFERYLRDVPEAANRSVVEARIQILRTAIAEREERNQRPTTAEVPPPTSAEAAPVAARDSGRSVVPWVLVGVGGGAAVVGAVFVGLGYSDASTVAGAPQNSNWSSVSGAYDRAPRRQGIGFALAGVGVATAVTGVILAVTGRSSDDEAAHVGVSGWVERGSAGVVTWGRF